MQIVERARDIYGEILEQIPSGYMFEKVMREIFEDEDESHWLLNSEEARRANVGLLLSIFKLKRYLGKNFKKNKGKAQHN